MRYFVLALFALTCACSNSGSTAGGSTASGGDPDLEREWVVIMPTGKDVTVTLAAGGKWTGEERGRDKPEKAAGSYTVSKEDFKTAVPERIQDSPQVKEMADSSGKIEVVTLKVEEDNGKPIADGRTMKLVFARSYPMLFDARSAYAPKGMEAAVKAKADKIDD